MSIDVNPDWWKSLFDEIYLLTDARSVCDDRITCREVNVFSELIPLRPEHRIMDLCGGHGRHALELCRRGYPRCSVLDYSLALLRLGVRTARQNDLPVEFVNADARQLPLPGQGFEHVLILGNSLGYAGRAGADEKILREAHRTLKVAGWLLVDVTDGQAVRRHFSANAWHEIGEEVVVCRQRELGEKTLRARELVLNKKTGLLRDKTYGLRLYTSDELMKMLASAGFSDITVHNDFSPHPSEDDLGFMNHRMVVTGKKR